MKILNLFAGLGGNRTLWEGHQITAVEWDEAIAEVYKKRFPNDEVIVTDAYEYLEDHFTEFDFIWASPPCTTHTSFVKVRVGRKYNETYKNDKIHVPDLRLYGLIIFLRDLYRGKWVVENVMPFYKPLIEPTARVGRHVIWSNCKIEDNIHSESCHNLPITIMAEKKGVPFDLIQESDIKLRKDTLLHNTMNPKDGLYILREVLKNDSRTL